MSAAALLSEERPPGAAQSASLLAPVRVTGGVTIAFASGPRGTYAARFSEADGYRVRFPRGGIGAEAVLLNTGGGVAGGDQVSFDITAEAASSATVTTQSAERIYRALGPGPARLSVRLTVGEDARLTWLPQGSILFSGARVSRAIEADVAPRGRLLMTEILVFGRKAMGETVTAGAFADRWRIRRGGRLAYADNVKLDGPIAALMSRGAIADGARVIGTILMIAADAEDKLAGVREALGASQIRIAASAWNGMLAVRCLGHDSEAVHRAVASVVPVLTGSRMPRVWAT